MFLHRHRFFNFCPIVAKSVLLATACPHNNVVAFLGYRRQTGATQTFYVLFYLLFTSMVKIPSEAKRLFAKIALTGFFNWVADFIEFV
jgi:hypothetical protein